MQIFDAKKVLADEKRIYKTISGVELDVTFVPYACQIEYEKYLEKEAEVLRLLAELRTVIKEIEQKKNLEENQKRVQRYQDLKDEIREDSWRVIEMALAANGYHYTRAQLQEFITVREFPFFIQFILGLDEESKKNKKSKVKGSSDTDGHIGKFSGSSSENTTSRSRQHFSSTTGKKSRR